MDSTLVRGRLANIIIDIGHNFEQFWVFLGRELWPVKGRRYFEASLELVLSIAADHRKARSIQLIYVLLAMSAALAIVQCLNTQPTFMLLTFDYFGYNQQASNIKIFKAMINITAFHYYKIFYIRFGKMKEFKNHIRVITHDDRTLLPDSSFDFWQLILWCLRFYQVMVVGFEMILIGCYLKFCVALWCASFGPLSYLSMSIGFVLFSATILLVCVGGFAASLTVYSIKALFERLHFQSRRYLHRRINRLTPVRLLQHRRVNAQTMRLQFALSPIYGQVLLTFLWTNLPLNVYLVTMLILNSMPDKNFFYFSIVAILGQVTVIVFFHLAAAMVTDRLHRPYTTIYSQFVRYRRSTLSSHVRVSTNIEAFLVRKRYGVTYQQFGMNFGLVSMAAFFKFVLLYLEMVLFSYNMYFEFIQA